MNLRSSTTYRKPSNLPGSASRGLDERRFPVQAFRREGLPRAGHLTWLFSCCVLIALMPGCTLCQNITRSVLSEPTRFSVTADRWRSVRTYREWADEAYGRFCSCGQAAPFSCSYEDGFKDGFVDYVYGGGSGEPPPVPPREFWDVRSRTTDGRACAADWFDGYRHGAQVARDEGYRDRALVPTSKLLACDTEHCEYEMSPYHRSQTTQETDHSPLLQPDTINVESVPLGALEPSPQDLRPAETMPAAEALELQLSEPAEITPSTQAAELPDPPLSTPEPIVEPDAAPVEQSPVVPETISPEAPQPSPEIPPAEDLDEIFGPRVSLRGSTSPPAARSQQLHDTEHDRDVQEARAAFASAIRRHQRVKQEFATARPMTATIQQTSAYSEVRPRSITRSIDRSQGMFRHLSR